MSISCRTASALHLLAPSRHFSHLPEHCPAGPTGRGLAPASLVPEGLGCRPLELSFFLRQARALRPGTSTGYLPRARALISLAPCSTWHLQEAASSVLKTVTLGEAGLLFEKRSQRTQEFSLGLLRFSPSIGSIYPQPH